MVKENKKKKSKKDSQEKDESEGMSLDDAFGDDEDVEYAPSKPRKEKKNKKNEDLDEELDDAEEELEELSSKVNGREEQGPIALRAGKPIAKIKKGDRIKIDGKEYIVDDHDVLIDHGSTKEMAIDLYDPENDKDYQLRYFNDQIETTLEFYELQEIMYIKKVIKSVEW